MPRKRTFPFNPRPFLAKIGEANEAVSYRRKQVVFAQGDPADAVYYIQKGKVKLTVVSKEGKEAVVALLGEDVFLGKDAWQGNPYAWLQPRQSRIQRSSGSKRR